MAHQEYWDGSGYPKGLKGEEIPIIARIIALTESYERFMHNLGDKMTPEKGIEFVRKNTGTRFDPEISRVFIKMIEEGIA